MSDVVAMKWARLDKRSTSDKYGIIAVTLGEFHDQVDRDNLPPMVWYMVGH